MSIPSAQPIIQRHTTPARQIIIPKHWAGRLDHARAYLLGFYDAQFDRPYPPTECFRIESGLEAYTDGRQIWEASQTAFAALDYSELVENAEHARDIRFQELVAVGLNALGIFDESERRVPSLADFVREHLAYVGTDLICLPWETVYEQYKVWVINHSDEWQPTELGHYYRTGAVKLGRQLAPFGIVRKQTRFPDDRRIQAVRGWLLTTDRGPY
jgi:hypothetical protein